MIPSFRSSLFSLFLLPFGIKSATVFNFVRIFKTGLVERLQAFRLLDQDGPHIRNIEPTAKPITIRLFSIIALLSADKEPDFLMFKPNSYSMAVRH